MCSVCGGSIFKCDPLHAFYLYCKYCSYQDENGSDMLKKYGKMHYILTQNGNETKEHNVAKLATTCFYISGA